MEEEELIERGKEIFNKLEPSLLPYYPNQYCVIHVPSQEYWVKKSLTEALKEASEKYYDGQFYSTRIGIPKGVIGEFK